MQLLFENTLNPSPLSHASPPPHRSSLRDALWPLCAREDPTRPKEEGKGPPPYRRLSLEEGRREKTPAPNQPFHRPPRRSWRTGSHKQFH